MRGGKGKKKKKKGKESLLEEIKREKRVERIGFCPRGGKGAQVFVLRKAKRLKVHSRWETTRKPLGIFPFGFFAYLAYMTPLSC